MNVELDTLLQRLLREAGFLEKSRARPQASAELAGVPLSDLTAAIEGDLVALHERGGHPLLIMQLAGALGIDPMGRFGAPSGEGPTP